MITAKKGKVIRLKSDRKALILLSAIFVCIAIWFLFTGLTAQQMETIEIVGITIGSIILALSILFLIPPIIISNLITPSKLVLRFGLLFKLELPLENISEAKQVDMGFSMPLIFGIGVRYSHLDRRLMIMGSKSRVVKLKLREKVIIGTVFRRIIEEIVLDLSEPKSLLQMLGETTSSGEFYEPTWQGSS